MGFPAWEGATHCTGSATPGAQALMRFIMEQYASKGSMNWGIYNCRDVRGGSTTSCHGEGRALDVGFPLGDPDGDALLKRLLKVPGRLGIQAIIYERRIYSALSPAGRPYTGEAAHYDHLHIELTRESGQRLTYETARRVLARRVRHAGSRTLAEGSSGADVRWLQGKLRIPADGQYGPKTRAAVATFEKKAAVRFEGKLAIRVDGVVGRNTWKALGVKPTY